MKKSDKNADCNNFYNRKTKKGLDNLIQSYLDQELLTSIPCNLQIANHFAKWTDVKQYKSNERIYEQGSFGIGQLFFVLNKSCQLFINNNYVRTLKAGQSFGEFPILDIKMQYTVSVEPTEGACIATISVDKFKEIAEKYPVLWKNLAKIVAQRLNSNSEEIYKKRRNVTPKIFIGSSVSSLDLARIVQSELSHDFEPVVWNQGVFKKLGNSYLECLEKSLEVFDFGIFILTGDDKIELGGKSVTITRDNVIFELGMYVGKLSRRRAFIVHPTDSELHLLSDIIGITSAKYDPKKEDLEAALGPACQDIRESIRSIYIKSPSSVVV